MTDRKLTIVGTPVRKVDASGHDFISCTYRIIVGKQPMMLINEKFPVTCPVTATK